VYSIGNFSFDSWPLYFVVFKSRHFVTFEKHDVIVCENGPEKLKRVLAINKPLVKNPSCSSWNQHVPYQSWKEATQKMCNGHRYQKVDDEVHAEWHGRIHATKAVESTIKAPNIVIALNYFATFHSKPLGQQFYKPIA
jgi:hypothetical protein